MRVRVDKARSWSAGPPSVLLKGPFFDGSGSGSGPGYDISPDGKWFLMIKRDVAPEQAPPALPSLMIVLNWFQELRRRVPVR